MPRQAREDGLRLLRTIENVEEPSIIAALRDVAPDLAELAISFAYGQVYPRDGLTLLQRQTATVAMLAAMGGLEPQLKFHMRGALNVGASVAQLVEVMIHLVVYAGFPTALNGVAALRSILTAQELGAAAPEQHGAQQQSRYDAGLAALEAVDGSAGEKVISSLAAVAPDLGRFIIEFAFGDVYTRQGMDLHTRELVTVAALAAMGNARPQLKVHTHGFLNVGGSREQLVEVAIQTAPYAGFPRAINAVLAIQEVLEERRILGH